MSKITDFNKKAAHDARIFKKTLLLTLSLAVSACDSLSHVGGPLLSSDFPPKGPPNYQKGMVDGCKTAATAYGAGTPMGLIYHKYYYDVDQGINDKVYSTAWNDGFHYCKFNLDATILS